MKLPVIYWTMKCELLDFAALDQAEATLASTLWVRAHDQPEYYSFENYWLKAVADFYGPRGLSRREIINSLLYRFGQDLAGRLHVAAGYARAPDYRAGLQAIIEKYFPTRRAFCDATGISEDMLSHVLAGRKQLSLDALEEALERIGFGLQIVPTGVNGSKRQTTSPQPTSSA